MLVHKSFGSPHLHVSSIEDHLSSKAVSIEGCQVDPEKILSKEFFSKIEFGSKRFLVKMKNFASRKSPVEKNVGPKKFWAPKNVGSKRILGPTKLLVQNCFRHSVLGTNQIT